MIVFDILKTKGSDVVTVSGEVTLAEASRLLASKRIGAVVVEGSGGPVAGILSERDIVKAVAANGPDALVRPVTAFMTTKVVTCTRNDPIDHLMEIMTGGRFRHVPVIENGALAGIVSIGDVVKMRIAEAEMEADQLKAYIATG